MNFSQLDNGDFVFDQPDGSRFIISFWSLDVVRVRYLPDGRPHQTRTWALVDANNYCPPEGFERDNPPRPQERPIVEQSEADGFVWLKASFMGIPILSVRIQTEPFLISWFSAAEGVLAEDMGGLAYSSTANGVTHTLKRNTAEHYYGLGEKSGPLDKHHRRFRMRATDAINYNAEFSDPLYKSIPFYITLTKQNHAFGLFYDTPYYSTFDFGSEVDGYYSDYRYFTAEGGDLDYYFINGPTISTICQQFSRLTGRMPLPPRWTLGYLGSSMNYTDQPNPEIPITAFVENCEKYEIPCTAFHLSSGYSLHNGKRYVFEWNFDRVPDPAAMVDIFHDAGMRVAPNIKPAMLTDHPRFDEVRPLFIKAADGSGPDLLRFWGGEGAHLDFTNPATAAWWKERVKTTLLNYGMDGIWNDNNEYHLRDGAAMCENFGQPEPVAGLRPVQTLLMAQASYEAQQEFLPERRPWVLSRAGGVGTARYAATWSGDNGCSWNTLRYNIPMGLGLSLSGWANTGHDVGGFVGGPPDPELLVRWVQNGIFHPRFTIHSWQEEGTTEPWMYPEVLPIIREAIQFRERLLPYLYTLMQAASESGEPIVRPMVYAFQHDPNCHTESFDFMLGDDLLVPNVIEPGATTREVYLPIGSEWFDWYTGEHYTGGQTITLDAPLDRFPLLVRANAVIPTYDDSTDTWILFAFPGQNAPGGAVIYLDDGETIAYQQGEYQEIRLKVAAAPNEVCVRHGGLTGNVEWRLPQTDNRPLIEQN